MYWMPHLFLLHIRHVLQGQLSGVYVHPRWLWLCSLRGCGTCAVHFVLCLPNSSVTTSIFCCCVFLFLLLLFVPQLPCLQNEESILAPVSEANVCNSRRTAPKSWSTLSSLLPMQVESAGTQCCLPNCHHTHTQPGHRGSHMVSHGQDLLNAQTTNVVKVWPLGTEQVQEGAIWHSWVRSCRSCVPLPLSESRCV